MKKYAEMDVSMVGALQVALEQAAHEEIVKRKKETIEKFRNAIKEN